MNFRQWLENRVWPAFGVLLLIFVLLAMYLTPFAIIFLACAFTFGLGLHKLLEARRARSWPTTTGRITKSRVDQIASVDSAEIGEYDQPGISYTYEVNGRRYGGRLLQRNDEYKTRLLWFLQRWLTRYPVGTVVEVYWCPNNPAISFIFPRPAAPWLFPLSGGFLFALIDVWMYLEAYAQNPAYLSWSRNVLTLIIGAACILFAVVMNKKSG